MSHSTLSLTALLLLGSAVAVSAPAREPVLVELFTSEGCSSCPPADALLETLDRTQPIDGAQVIVLSEHVDYWNRLGWTDPYSTPEASRRQQKYADRLRLDSVYTPQMVVDGHTAFIGSDEPAARKAIVEARRPAKSPITLTRTAKDKAHVTIAATPSNQKAVVYAALADDQNTTQVLRGENKGRQLRHVAILRQLTLLGRLSGSAPFEKEIAAPSQGRLIVFIQQPDQGAILGVATLSPATVTSTAAATK